MATSMKTVSPLAAVCLLVLCSLVGCSRSNAWVMNNSGVGYFQKGNYAMARNEFSRAVADNPKSADYRYNLAMAMQKLGDSQNAEQILRHNLSLDSMHQPSYHALAQNLVQQGRQGEAQEILTTWAETQPYLPESHVELAWLQRTTGDYTSAQQTLAQALQVDPENPAALAELGHVYRDQGMPQQAANYFQQSLASRSNQPAVESALASLNTTPGATPSVMNQPMMVEGMPVTAPMMASSDGSMMQDPALMARRGRRSGRRGMRTYGTSYQPEIVQAFPAAGMVPSNVTWAAPSTTMVSSVPQATFNGAAMTQLPPSPGMIPTMNSYPVTANVSTVSSSSAPTLSLPAGTNWQAASAAPTSIGSADPAHMSLPVPEMASGLQVVDPY